MAASPSTESSYINVWLPIPRWQSFTYQVTEDLPGGPPQVGQLVWVPFGRGRRAGLVASLEDQAPQGVKEIKSALEVFPPEFQLPEHLLRLFLWAKEHYLAPPGEVLRSFFPSQILKGNLDRSQRTRPRKNPEAFADDRRPQLNVFQEKAVNEVKSHLGKFFPILLHGITGSGKTEVYLRLCEEVLARGEGVLVLVPEISLTPQTMGRFLSRFGDQVASYHSAMTEVQRLHTWWEAKEGSKKIFVGTRSVLGLPVQKLGLIIVDEEHDSSYKQEERFRYQARDMAVVRAQFETIPVLLGSATPSFESWENVQRGKYHFVQIPERATQGTLPQIELVDLKQDPPHPETLLSEKLYKALQETLERKEQAILFLNRRGYAPFLLCQDCGEVPRCPNCEVSLTYHKGPGTLKCHYCEYSVSVPDHCGACKAAKMELMGLGTERIEEGLAQLFPGARIGRLDRDVAMSRNRTEQVLSQFEQGELDILVGTQLVSKGHDFKRLTLVGILLADVALNLPDFRAGERVYQMVTQVAGRAGRHALPGKVYLQSFRPEHPAIVAALKQDLEDFFVHEKLMREETGFPPFNRLLVFRLVGNSEVKTRQEAQHLSEHLRALLANFPDLEILGPTPASMEKLRGKYRWHVILRVKNYPALRKVLEGSIPQLQSDLDSGVQLQIDVDPVGLI